MTAPVGRGPRGRRCPCGAPLDGREPEEHLAACEQVAPWIRAWAQRCLDARVLLEDGRA